jgi:hypothetical protein
MIIFYECNVCGHTRDANIKSCPICEVGDMVAMTIIRKDVLDKLKFELKQYKLFDKLHEEKDVS